MSILSEKATIDSEYRSNIITRAEWEHKMVGLQVRAYIAKNLRDTGPKAKQMSEICAAIHDRLQTAIIRSPEFLGKWSSDLNDVLARLHAADEALKSIQYDCKRIIGSIED